MDRATRPGVFTSPSRAGSSPTSTRRRVIRSCIAVSYLAVIVGLGGGVPALDRAVGARRSRRAVSRSRTARERGCCRTDLDRSSRRRPGRLRVGGEARARALLAGHQRSGAGRREEAHPGARASRRAGRRRRRAPAPRTDISGWPRTWARWPTRTACARASSTARRSAKRSRRRRRLDPAFLDGSPDRALGRWYYKVPGLFGGDLDKSEQHLRTALDLQARQRDLAAVPGRDADQARSESRGPHHPRRRDRRAAGSGMDSGRHALQGAGPPQLAR